MTPRIKIGTLSAVLGGVVAVAALIVVLAVWERRPRLADARGSVVINGTTVGKAGRLFPPRSGLVTGEDSSCTVELGPNLAFHLGPNTVADVELDGSPPRIALLAGSLTCVVGADPQRERGPDSPMALVVRTAACFVETARGAFLVRIEEDPGAYACTCGAYKDPPITYVYAREGVLRVTDSGGLPRPVDASRYNSFQFGASKGQAVVSYVRAEGAAAEVVDSLAARFGPILERAKGRTGDAEHD